MTPLVSAHHPIEAHMRQVLQPFEVRDRNAARVEVEIGKQEVPPRAQDGVGVGHDGPVGRLRDQGSPNARRILRRNLVFQGGWDEDVAFHFQESAG